MNSGSNRLIFLCGMMGTGKSQVGKQLARKLNLTFTDLDSIIESETGMTINQIFKIKGEPGFREIERDKLHQCTQQSDGVVALGGGTLQNQQLVDLVKNSGILIFIDTPEEILLKRLKRSRRRPMIHGLNHDELIQLIRKLLDERLPYYNQANIIIPGDAKNEENTTELIIKELNQYND